MRRKNNFLVYAAVLFIMLPVLFMGCGGGGGGGDGGSGSDSAAGISITPKSYDFGAVPPGKSPEPLEVVIANNGTEGLTIEDFYLTDTDYDDYDLFVTEDDCNSGSPTLFPGDQCTVGVKFVRTETGDAPPEALQIKSDDPVYPVFSVNLEGSVEEINELHVRINQVESDEVCPDPTVKAYVSVTDQGGWPVSNIERFSITEGTSEYDSGSTLNGITYSPVKDSETTAAVALAMDYSKSITNIEDAEKDMEESVKSVIYRMDEYSQAHEAMIIKFADEVKVVTDFTSYTGVLIDAVDQDDEWGSQTVFYGAVREAILQTAAQAGDGVRKAVIVLTDGEDIGSDDGGRATKLDYAIEVAQENDVPVFTIGIGEGDVLGDFKDDLRELANKTGGLYYDAQTPDNLKTVYRQLADLLYEGQYILTYDSGLTSGDGAELRVRAEEYINGNGETISSDDSTEETKTIEPCP